MSVRINLLPQEATERQAAARQHRLIALGAVVLVAGLGSVSVWQNGRIDDAQSRLADEEAVLASLMGEVAQLREFADLDTAHTTATQVVQQAMSEEASLAGVLQDIAAVMPSDAEIESVALMLNRPTVVDATAETGAGEVTMGTLAVTGRSASAHAPGVERLLLDFDKVAGFRDLFVSNSTLEDPEVGYPQFSIEAQLGPEVLTGRYVTGIPEELR